MIIRFKKNRTPEPVEIMTDAANIDYWIDTEKRSLSVDICGKTYVVRRGKESALEQGLDLIHEAVTKGLPFVDLTGDHAEAGGDVNGN